LTLALAQHPPGSLTRSSCHDCCAKISSSSIAAVIRALLLVTRKGDACGEELLSPACSAEIGNCQVGGLGDVVTGLARACLEEGHKVEVILPFYQCLPESSVNNLRHVVDFQVPKVSVPPDPQINVLKVAFLRLAIQHICWDCVSDIHILSIAIFCQMHEFKCARTADGSAVLTASKNTIYVGSDRS
jgi:hypothetical protein